MTYDFATFLVSARTLGADHVHFRFNGKLQAKKFPAEVAWKRFENIVKPLCDLAGVTHSIGPGGSGIEPEAHAGTVEALYRKLGRIWKFPQTGKGDYVTVTLRDSFRNQHRNSSPAWAEFIERSKRKVIVLPECEDNPIPISLRMELYANAAMNFGVNNGPMALCLFSEAPYRVFKMLASDDMRRHHEKTGFPKNSQFSFRNDKQLIVWKDDTLDVLMSHIED